MIKLPKSIKKVVQISSTIKSIVMINWGYSAYCSSTLDTQVVSNTSVVLIISTGLVIMYFYSVILLFNLQ